MANRPWVRLPSDWIEKGGLKSFSWKGGGEGANNIAALMALTGIAHAAEDETGIARVTYDDLCARTGLSRAKLSAGLHALKTKAIIGTLPDAPQSHYQLANYKPDSGWAKFPCKSLYSGDRIISFDEFRLRRQVELDALKLLFLFVARRDRTTNMAQISYEKIETYTAIRRNKIKPALSFLASLSLVYVEYVPSRIHDQAVANSYRIVGIETSAHLGTRGRALADIRLGADVSVAGSNHQSEG